MLLSPPTASPLLSVPLFGTPPTHLDLNWERPVIHHGGAHTRIPSFSQYRSPSLTSSSDTSSPSLTSSSPSLSSSSSMCTSPYGESPITKLTQRLNTTRMSPHDTSASVSRMSPHDTPMGISRKRLSIFTLNTPTSTSTNAGTPISTTSTSSPSPLFRSTTRRGVPLLRAQRSQSVSLGPIISDTTSTSTSTSTSGSIPLVSARTLSYTSLPTLSFRSISHDPLSPKAELDSVPEHTTMSSPSSSHIPSPPSSSSHTDIQVVIPRTRKRHSMVLNDVSAILSTTETHETSPPKRHRRHHRPQQRSIGPLHDIYENEMSHTSSSSSSALPVFQLRRSVSDTKVSTSRPSTSTSTSTSPSLRPFLIRRASQTPTEARTQLPPLPDHDDDTIATRTTSLPIPSIPASMPSSPSQPHVSDRSITPHPSLTTRGPRRSHRDTMLQTEYEPRLPCHKIDGVHFTSTSTVASLLARHHYGVECNLPTYDHIYLMDCRFPYEYDGGHLMGAINITSHEQLEQTLFTSILADGESQHESYETRGSRIAIVIHCEFSRHRGPAAAKYIRARDRDIHGVSGFPRLFYPELYVMDGGYKSFYETYVASPSSSPCSSPVLCEPMAYVPMTAPQHHDAYLHHWKRMNHQSKQMKRERERRCTSTEMIAISPQPTSSPIEMSQFFSTNSTSSSPTETSPSPSDINLTAFPTEPIPHYNFLSPTSMLSDTSRSSSDISLNMTSPELEATSPTSCLSPSPQSCVEVDGIDHELVSIQQTMSP